jgi:hypothetical protein
MHRLNDYLMEYALRQSDGRSCRPGAPVVGRTRLVHPRRTGRTGKDSE